VQHHQCHYGFLRQQLHSLCVPHWSLPLGLPHSSCSCKCTQATIVSLVFVVCFLLMMFAVHCFSPLHFSAMRCLPISTSFWCAESDLSCGDSTIRLWLILMLLDVVFIDAFSLVLHAKLEQCVCSLPGGWTTHMCLCSFLFVWFAVFGVGFGMWASITNLVQNVSTYSVFAECYQCAGIVKTNKING